MTPQMLDRFQGVDLQERVYRKKTSHEPAGVSHKKKGALK